MFFLLDSPLLFSPRAPDLTIKLPVLALATMLIMNDNLFMVLAIFNVADAR